MRKGLKSAVVHKRIAIIGSGPSGMFALKRLVDSEKRNLIIHIFEKKEKLGAGMPYSVMGANDEHITNVSDNEIPVIVTPIKEWVKTADKGLLDHFDIDPKKFNEYKVLPRLFFGEYLSDQFQLLLDKAKKVGIEVNLHTNTYITDITSDGKSVTVLAEQNQSYEFDHIIISTGHNWPKKQEGITPGYYDSPYPPSKLMLAVNYPVAVRGSSLTAVDAVKTLAKANGNFKKGDGGKLHFSLKKGRKGFKIVMHTKNGMLPGMRFHLEDTHLRNKSLLTDKDISAHIKKNKGFLSLDFLFNNDFKEPVKAKDPDFYEHIKDMSLEQFVSEMMEQREHADAFQLLKSEYIEAARSIKKRRSVYWKEMLGVLSFALNYPAKHLPAEDMQRLQKTLLPLISIIIAYMPQSSAEQFLALHEAGLLEIVAVGEGSEVIPGEKDGAVYHFTDERGIAHSDQYKLYIDCIGQPHLPFDEFPFKGLTNKGDVTPASLRFKSQKIGKSEFEAGNKAVCKDKEGNYFLSVSGIAITDNFQVIDLSGKASDLIYLMAVPYMGGFNPDYSGLDFCEEASERIVKTILNN